MRSAGQGPVLTFSSRPHWSLGKPPQPTSRWGLPPSPTREEGASRSSRDLRNGDYGRGEEPGGPHP